jgi:hypothetical protein
MRVSWQFAVGSWQRNAARAVRALPTANRQLPTIAALLLLALAASAAAQQDLNARALLSYQSYRIGRASTTGLRQTYDLRLERAFTMTSLVRLFVREDDFRGTAQFATAPQDTRTRQFQPAGELIVNTTNLHAQLRGEVFDTRSRVEKQDSSRRIDRSFGQMVWEPDRLPTLTLMGQRNKTVDSASSLQLTDDNALASLQYGWRDVHATAGERYLRSADPLAGFDRRMTTHEGNLTYASTSFGGKLVLTAEGNAQLSQIRERSLGGKTTFIPTQQSIARALYGIDDTPSDDRDHPLGSAPALTDGNLATGSGINLGPDGLSFHNIAVDLGRIDRVDEIRVVVRDAAGNPPRNGGGPVTWDAYTSQDGDVWTPIAGAQTAFSAALSLYSVAFTLTNARWFKVVSFGVNGEQTIVTEVQAYYHAEIGAGSERASTQNFYVGTANIVLQPVRRLHLSYTGTYSGIEQRLADQPRARSKDLEQLGEAQFDIRSWLSVRSQFLQRDARSFTGTTDSASGVTAYLDINPSRQWRNSIEVSRQKQVLGASQFTIDTNAIHSSAFVYKSLFLGFDAGTQTQSLSSDGSTAKRTFLNLTGNIQIFPTLRVLLSGTVQRNDTISSDPATELLGPTRDNRLSSEFIWRPGRPLTLSVRLGHVSGQSLSGFTQRYHVEWYPFGDGTVSLGGSYDQDIDPVVDRRATRMIVNPRWVMNRFVIFDVNYTSVSSTFSTFENRQHSLFATVTLIK